MLNVPNSITLLRIFCVPVFLSVVSREDYRLALVIFVIAGITDSIDGAIARLTNTRTDLGAHLDPLADKLLLVSSYIALGILGAVPIQLMILVIVRDTVILGGFLLSGALVGRYMEMAPSAWGKLTTFLQLLTVTSVLLVRGLWVSVDASILTAVFLLTGVATVISGVDYVLQGARWYQESTPPAS